MTREKLATLQNLLGELADEITTGEFTNDKSRLVDCILVVVDHLGKEGD